MLDKWFRGSHTLVWSRLQMVVGALWYMLTMTDLGPLLTSVGLGKYVPPAVFVMGAVTEGLRRYKAEDLKKVV